jgi:AsmA protein
MLKYFAFALGGVAALLAAAAAVLVATFDAERIKTAITDAVREKKGRTLAIGGDVELSFWPGLGIVLGKVSLSERDSDEEFAAIDRVRMSAALLPLLSKRLVVDDLRLDGVRAALVRDARGRFNFDDLLAKDEQDSESMRFDIAGVQLRDGQLSYRDEASGRRLTLEQVHLTSGWLGNAAEGPLSLSLRVGAEQPTLAASVSLSGSYRYDLDRGQYAFSGLNLRVQGAAGRLRDIDATIEAIRLGLRAEPIEIELEKLQLTATGKAAADAFDIRLDAPRLIATADKATGEAINIGARLAGDAGSFEARLGLAGVEGSAAALRVAKFKLDVDARQGEAAVKGGLTSALAASLPAQTLALPQFAGELSVAHPAMPMKSVRLPVSGSLQADLLKSAASGNIATRFDDSNIRAKWTVPKFSPLAFGFDVDVDRLDVDRYFPPRPAPAQGAASEAPLDFSGIRGIDASGTLRIGSLQMRNVRATNIRVDLRAAGGKLEASPLSASLYQGHLAGSVSLHADGNRVQTRQNLTGVAINPLMRDAIDKDLLEGSGNLALELAGSGATVSALKRSLSGSASVALKDGAIKGINLGKTFRDLKAAARGGDSLHQASATEKTDFTDFNASFRVANGVAHNSDLLARSPLLHLTGDGDIDIAESSINYLAKASIVAASTGQEGKELAPLKGATVPVRMIGPFAQPSYRIAMGNLLKGMAEARIEERKQRVQEKVQDRLQEQPKGVVSR